MRPAVGTDRARVQAALTTMYRGVDRPTPAVLDEAALAAHCCRRQLERAFEAYATSPVAELSHIRAELAGAHLVQESAPRFGLIVVARRVG